MCGERYFRFNFAALWVSAILCGISVPLFLGSAYVCTKIRPNKLIFIAVILLFGSGTIQAILLFIEILVAHDAICGSDCTGVVCISCYQATQQVLRQTIVSDRISAVGSLFGAFAQLASDGIMIYRVYILWQKRIWAIVIPSLSLIGATVAGLWYSDVAIQLAMLLGEGPLNAANWQKFVALNVLNAKLDGIINALTTATTVLTTLLIVSRIWWMTRDIGNALGSRTTQKYHRTMRMIVESGLVYSISLTVAAVFQFYPPLELTSAPIVDIAAGLSVNCILLLSIAHITIEFLMQVIAPMLIVIRVGLGERREQTDIHLTVPQARPPVPPAHYFTPQPEQRLSLMEVTTAAEIGQDTAIGWTIQEVPLEESVREVAAPS
ncbi:hypothetical protein JAAARDRAFT_670641 [Jaapia argillacea MUCL 33604]|uniref:G-protein coupled receptors family 1 profile domain-containing protein n=1 Tax=Jaapia argillacea MUCL 33604 TaxID=933084 RepID=A0A067Q4V8_9AGAM|nr:hypothetical protein JAAARDRAFT_670641 [Jaapia argillacea MUCL 33604]